MIPIEFLGLVGDGNRQWLEPQYVADRRDDVDVDEVIAHGELRMDVAGCVLGPPTCLPPGLCRSQEPDRGIVGGR